MMDGPTVIAGIFIGALLGFVATAMSPPFHNLQTAQYHYTRCLSDGGTPQHCAQTYLLPKEEK